MPIPELLFLSRVSDPQSVCRVSEVPTFVREKNVPDLPKLLTDYIAGY